MTTSFSAQVSESVRAIVQEGLFGHEFSLERVLVVTTIVVVVAVIYVCTKD